ncbi:MAG: insulinase family protein [Acidobacteria bacterium]|nr:insulinase family protein [Acidobacteriota bacterium]
MKTLAWCGALLLLALSFAPAALTRADRTFPFDFKRMELSNGLRAYLIPTKASGQIAYITIVRTGAREEYEPGRSGFAHFFEHMMFRGTRKYPDYDAVTTRMGAARNASTSSDVTQYYLVASKDSLEQIIDLESDRFMNLEYSEAAFRTEAGAILGEFSQGRANPMLHLYEKLMDTAFDVHTYEHLTIGFEKDVRAMPEGYEYSIAFHKRYYRPENCVILLTGDFDPKHAEQLIRKYYSPWKRGYVPPEIKPEPPQQAPREAIVEFPGQTLPTVSVAYKGPAWSATDRLSVAAEVLGMVAFGPNSRIYRKLVIQDQKVQALTGDFALNRDPGLLLVLAMVNREEDVPAVLREIENTAEEFQEKPCDPKLLNDTRSAMKYGFLMSLETPQGINFALRDFAVFTGGIEAVDEYYKTLDSITPADVQAAAKKFLVDNGRTTVTLLSAREGK